jgi:CBS domain-containing protein|tara:strand:+ start:165 stop:626 length:462 start_codon:yes stop_codon:yes gene_type:complete
LKKIKKDTNIKMAGKLVTKLSTRQCFTLTEKDTLKTASEKFQKYNVGVMPVLNEKDKTVIGIISERDLARCIYRDEFKSDLLVNKIMTKNIISCDLNNSVTELMEMISSYKIRHILIIEKKKLLGIVSIGDVVNHIIEQYKDENRQLRDFINQ